MLIEKSERLNKTRQGPFIRRTNLIFWYPPFAIPAPICQSFASMFPYFHNECHLFFFSPMSLTNNWINECVAFLHPDQLHAKVWSRPEWEMDFDVRTVWIIKEINTIPVCHQLTPITLPPWPTRWHGVTVSYHRYHTHEYFVYPLPQVNLPSRHYRLNAS